MSVALLCCLGCSDTLRAGWKSIQIYKMDTNGKWFKSVEMLNKSWGVGFVYECIWEELTVLEKFRWCFLFILPLYEHVFISFVYSGENENDLIYLFNMFKSCSCWSFPYSEGILSLSSFRILIKHRGSYSSISTSCVCCCFFYLFLEFDCLSTHLLICFCVPHKNRKHTAL